MSDPISVIVVDDHSLFRAGVIQSLQLDDRIRVVGEGGTGQDAVNLAVAHSPDVALIDISMPGDGIAAARGIAEKARSTRVVMLTVSENDDDVMRSLEAGAVGYILKGIRAADLLVAVKSVAAGGSFLSPDLAVRLLAGTQTKRKASRLASLSMQERRTLRLVASGLSNREVGERLGIVEKTVKFHLASIFAKLDVRNRVEASLLAREEWDSLNAPEEAAEQERNRSVAAEG